MRHRKQNQKLGRSGAHREALVSALVVSLIKHRSIKTTVVKAKIARQTAEKMVTIARKGILTDPAATDDARRAAHSAARRLAVSRLRDEDAAEILIKQIMPMFEGRAGGYTRILRTGTRCGDGSEMAILQWVEATASASEGSESTAEATA